MTPEQTLTDYERWVLSCCADGWTLLDLGLLGELASDATNAVARICRKLDAACFEHALQIYRTQESQ